MRIPVQRSLDIADQELAHFGKRIGLESRNPLVLMLAILPRLFMFLVDQLSSLAERGDRLTLLLALRHWVDSLGDLLARHEGRIAGVGQRDVL